MVLVLQRNEIGLLCLLYEKAAGVLHVIYNSDVRDEQRIPEKYRGQFALHISENGIRAEGHKSVLVLDENEKLKFLGKGTTNSAVLKEFSKEGITGDVMHLYEMALAYTEPILPFK